MSVPVFSVPEKTANSNFSCLRENSVFSWVLQEITHLQRQNYLKVVLKYCQCMPMQQAKAGLRWTCTVSCPPPCPQPAQEVGWGQTEEGVSHGTTPHSQALPGGFFSMRKKVTWKILNEETVSPDFLFSQKKKPTKPEPSASLCLAHWNGYIKLIPTSSPSLWSMRDGRGDQD